MATLNFTIDEALNILWANGIGGENIKKIKADRDGLLMTVTGGIDIMVRQESFANGMLKLAITSKSWAFKLADKAGMIDAKIDELLKDRPFINRENKTLTIDLNRALQSKIKGISVQKFVLSEGQVRIEF
ncbi:MAG TPA: hypothetical protein VMZ49_00895 [Patescibacteria group bacterium]|nr:hypothetical protein [Patescibacteria group bacterium]